jgi:3-isopropylmalate dehydrogenase
MQSRLSQTRRAAASALPARSACSPVSSRRAVACAATHKICVLPGDGIGPEIMEVALKVLTAAGKKHGEEFVYTKELMGGAAIDATGKPLPEQTLATAKASDSVLLAAIGG